MNVLGSRSDVHRYGLPAMCACRCRCTGDLPRHGCRQAVTVYMQPAANHKRQFRRLQACATEQSLNFMLKNEIEDYCSLWIILLISHVRVNYNIGGSLTVFNFERPFVKTRYTTKRSNFEFSCEKLSARIQVSNGGDCYVGVSCGRPQASR